MVSQNTVRKCGWNRKYEIFKGFVYIDNSSQFTSFSVRNLLWATIRYDNHGSPSPRLFDFVATPLFNIIYVHIKGKN